MAARDLVVTSTRIEKGPRPERLADRYRSLFVIGRGGMGSVEAALEIGHHATEDGYERVVALKRLLPEAARDTRRSEMFLREARLAAMLEHPNVVRAFDFGEVDGELFLAMEYVEGQPLSVVLRTLAAAKPARGLNPSLVAHVLAEVSEGLHAAHELTGDAGQPLQLVHRDVSPQNVMLGYDAHVRLLDFGVAKIEAESVTKTGEVKGKTAYMSPEQAMGDAIDRRSDLFGLGAVLFECVALRRMWGDGTDMEVIRKLALEEPPRLDEEVPTAPRDLCALYMRLVAREASERPASAREVSLELRKLVPQGRDAAASELRAILHEHFGAQAEAQRRRLENALEEVAPEQARELRESVVPKEMREAVPLTEVAAKPRAKTWLIGLAILVAASVAVASRAVSSHPTTDPAPHDSTTSTASIAPIAETATATATATTVVNPPASIATTATTAPRILARPSANGTAKVAPSASTALPPPTISAKPASSKPPLDIDDHPF